MLDYGERLILLLTIHHEYLFCVASFLVIKQSIIEQHSRVGALLAGDMLIIYSHAVMSSHDGAFHRAHTPRFDVYQRGVMAVSALRFSDRQNTLPRRCWLHDDFAADDAAHRQVERRSSIGPPRSFGSARFRRQLTR